MALKLKMTDHRTEYLKKYYQQNKPAYRQRAKKFREKKKKEDQDWVDNYINVNKISGKL